MLALDNSYSMGLTDSGKNKSRLAILKDSLRDVLQGVKDANGNYTTTPLPDNTIVGLSVFGNGPRHGRILVAARALNERVSITSSKTQRELLIEEINKVSANASTPTSLLYGEAVSYLRGTATSGPLEIKSINDGVDVDKGPHTKFDSITDSSLKSPLVSGMFGGRYIAPMSKLSAEEQQCSAQGIFFFTDGAPTTITPLIAEPIYKNALNDMSFSCESTETPAIYYHLKNVDGYHRGAGVDKSEVKEMGYADATRLQNKIVVAGVSGKNSYVNGKHDVYEDRSAWQCIGAMAKRIAFDADPKKRIYTAIVGFGPDFNEDLSASCPEVDDSKVLDDKNNLITIKTYAGHTRYKYCGSPSITSDPSRGYSNGLNVQNAFSWGELGKGTTSKLHYPDASDTHPANIIPERGGYFDASNGESQPIIAKY